MRTLSWAQVLGRRLARGRLLEPASPVEAASAAAGIHAQILSAAELSLSARTATTIAEVRAELWERRRLVKTWLHRGTLHVVPAVELPLWNAALGPPQEPELADAIAAVLDDEPRSRGELADLVGDERLRSAWGEGLKAAARAGVLVYGPSRGATTTFVRAPRVGAAGEDALAWALRRYLDAYGPARHGDFATWLGIPTATAKAAFAAAELEPVRVEGRRASALPGGDWEPAASVLLLPQYDCYLMGSRFGRELVLPAAVGKRALAHGRGPYEGAVAIPTVVVDGVVAGFWRREGRTVTVELLARVPRRAVEAEVERLRAFLDDELALAYGAAF